LNFDAGLLFFKIEETKIRKRFLLKKLTYLVDEMLGIVFVFIVEIR